MNQASTKLSGKKIIKALFVLLITTIAGVGAIILGYPIGLYAVYIAVPMGAILTITAGILNMIGQIERDF